ncbi:baculoviral IAP repeat-containing protein 2-like [Neocloeon triangulifer]|uniref:baculoviral IAP repeat-containing protein 2-like n=1 Tax=Neocloeon triangulifer TaxID=2078957 RepID=UPI00286F2E49|nr:baculoviral IAP repeat-containing protein 2-like [Neocloeon triangulifer]XP_059470723.1 baculoviral IAP repeat-containing protein 2-like [Neocloeon triangulifer]
MRLTEPREPCPKLRLNLAIHRLSTFPFNFKGRFGWRAHFFANVGFYCLESEDGSIVLHCHFCQLQINESVLLNWSDRDTCAFLIWNRSECPIKLANSDNVPLPKDNQLNYRFESHWLYSLLKKDDWKFVTPPDLARDGFYYMGDGDKCRCIFCNLEVSAWEKGDKVQSEHRHWNSGCPFLQNPSSVPNIPIGEETGEVQCDVVAAKPKVGSQHFPTDNNAQEEPEIAAAAPQADPGGDNDPQQ